MKRTTIDLLRCPTCHAKLSLREEQSKDGIEQAALICSSCGACFPIEKGIPKFVCMKELSGLNRHFARLYDIFSYIYAPVTRSAFFFLGGEEKARRDVLDRLDSVGGRILEVSIGTGSNLPFLLDTQQAIEIFGLDISLGQLQRCLGYCRRHGWAVELFQGTAEALPFVDGSFDAVLHVGGINFFSDKQKAIDEMIRVARPGARIVVADESERGARAYERFLPGFLKIFQGKREPVVAPVDLVPSEMKDVRTIAIWRGMGYCLEFRKPPR